MTDKHVRVIAEIGVNHNGDIALAKELVHACAEAGAGYVKFQMFRAGVLAREDARSAEYQAQRGFGHGQRRMLESLELTPGQFSELAELSRSLGVEFLSSHFDRDSLRFLADEVGVSYLKIASGELTNYPLLLEAARTGLPLLVSTGMATLEEVRDALGLIAFGCSGGSGHIPPVALGGLTEDPGNAERIRSRVVLFQCTSEYPTPSDQANLRALSTMKGAFGTAMGLSDHTEGLVASLLAVALGATWIEKHVTLDRSLPGPDHHASLTPDELERLVVQAEEAETLLGSGEKVPTQAELETRSLVRRSLVAARPMIRGQVVSPEDLATKRPGDGLHPRHYWRIIGRPADRDYQPDEPLCPEILE